MAKKMRAATEQRKEICPDCGECSTRLLYWSDEDHEVSIREFAESSDETIINFPFYVETWECTECQTYEGNRGTPLIFSVMLKMVWRDQSPAEYRLDEPGNQTVKVIKDWVKQKTGRNA